MKRKDWITLVSSASGTLALSRFSKPNTVNKKRVLRIAHLTDCHINKGRNSVEWVKKCLEHIEQQTDSVDIIFNGGDTINDALRQDENSVIEQWELWEKATFGLKLPIKHCIGNHDVWGISDAKTDARYAKAWAVEKLGLPNRYYDYEQNGWHFIVLDSTHIKEDGTWYTAKLDEEQFEWLKVRLQQIPSDRPIFIFSHIPIVCAASFFDGDNETSGNWRIPGAWVHIDARRIVELFHEHRNVKVAVSGHIHLVDAVKYNEVTYYCNGAVAGRWWGGDYHQTPPGYAIVNLYADGSFDRDYVPYGWTEA